MEKEKKLSDFFPSKENIILVITSKELKDELEILKMISTNSKFSSAHDIAVDIEWDKIENRISTIQICYKSKCKSSNFRYN